MSLRYVAGNAVLVHPKWTKCTEGLSIEGPFFFTLSPCVPTDGVGFEPTRISVDVRARVLTNDPGLNVRFALAASGSRWLTRVSFTRRYRLCAPRMNRIVPTWQYHNAKLAFDASPFCTYPFVHARWHAPVPSRRCLIGRRRVWTVSGRTCAMRCGR